MVGSVGYRSLWVGEKWVTMPWYIGCTMYAKLRLSWIKPTKMINLSFLIIENVVKIWTIHDFIYPLGVLKGGLDFHELEHITLVHNKF